MPIYLFFMILLSVKSKDGVGRNKRISMIIMIFLAIEASARPGYCFTQYEPDLYHPVGHLPPSSLGRASLSEPLMRLQYDPPDE
jgi:hypothetical protein